MKNLSLILTVSFFAATASAASLKLNCDGQNPATDQQIEIDGSQMTVTSQDKVNGLTFTAIFDPKYKPHGAPKVRFSGEENGNSRDVIVAAGLLSGDPKGFVQIRGNEDGYWSLDYNCTVQN